LILQSSKVCLETARGQHLSARGIFKLRHLADKALVRRTALQNNDPIVRACHLALMRNPELQRPTKFFDHCVDPCSSFARLRNTAFLQCF